MINRTRIYVGLAVCLVCVAAGIAAPRGKVLFEGKSEFNRSVKVVEDAEGLRTLMFDNNGDIQSTVKLGDPDRLPLRYTRVMPVALAAVEKPKRIAIVGLGGGSIPNFLHKHYPDTHIDVVDIDPLVVEVARKYFAFREDKTLRVHVADGRAFIEKCEKPYDLIFLDAYGADDIPYALATREFLQAVRKAVTGKGVVVTNLMSRSSNRLYDSMIRTYIDVFDEVHVVDVRDSGNVILLALPHQPKLTKDTLARQASKLTREKKFPYNLGRLVKYGYRRPDEKEKSAPILLDKKKKAAFRLLTKADMKYAGGFKLPGGTGGKGKNRNFSYSSGVIAYDMDRNSFYAAGHNYIRGIAEVSNPGLVNSVDLSRLPRAEYVQNFRNILDGLPSGNPDKLSTLGGLYTENGAILFTAYEFYDADCSVRDVFGVLKDNGRLAESAITGFYKTGHGAHTAGWVSPIPAEYRSALKGTHIIGNGKSQSIAGRYPLRPTAFSFEGSDIFGNKKIDNPLKVTRLIDGNLKNPLPAKMWNNALDEAYYGIIIPGTGAYVCFGHRGGMHSKIGYKITTDDGRLTGGYAARDDDDHYMYYWMYKVDDMVRAAKGQADPFKVYPYEHGKLALPFLAPNSSGSIGGGTWDPKTKTVYLCLKGRDRVSRYTIIPIIAGVQFEKYDGKDTTAPYGAMTEPNAGAKVSGRTAIEAHAIDNVDEENDLKVQFTVNGKNYGKPATQFPFRVSWDTTKFQNGKYQVSAVASDKAGNKRKINDVAVTVEN